MKNRKGIKLNTISTVLMGIGSIFATNPLLAMTPVASAHSHLQPGVEVLTRGNLEVVDHAHKHRWFKLNGLIQADNTVFMGDMANLNNQYPSGAALRNARLGINGGVTQHWSYKFEVDYNPGANVYVKSAYLNYAGFAPQSHFQIGQINPSFGLDWTADTAANLFMGPNLASATFSAPDALGIVVELQPADMFAMQFSVYQPDANFSQNNKIASSSPYSTTPNSSKADRWGGTARVIFSPIHTHEVAYHLGLSALHQSLLATDYRTEMASGYALYNSPSNLEAQARSTPNLLGIGSNSTGTGENLPQRLKYFQQAALELAGIMGPLLVQGEYFTAKLARYDAGLNDLKPKAWYAQVAYLLTGEMRPYDAAKGVINNPSAQSECGAWEVAARISALNLKSQEVDGGSQHDTTLGLNWYANRNIRMSANYVRASIHPSADQRIASLPAKRKVNSLGLRFQATW